MGAFRRAACVVLYRKTAGEPELLLTRRSEHLAFLGGFDAFPGGSLDDADDAVELAFEDAPYRVAAVRELFEEVGVLLAQRAERLTPAARDELRRAVLADGSRFVTLLAAHGLRLSPELLLTFGRWVSPPYTPMRFDALYYAAELPAAQEAVVWPGELTRCEWVSPSAALRRHQAGDLFISFPVLETIKRLAQAGCDFPEASRRMQARGFVTYPHAGGEMLGGLYMAPGRTPTLPPATHTNTYVLGGEQLVVVDPATPYEDDQKALIAFLEHLQGEGGKVVEVWLTHHHHDHVGAVELVRRHFGVPVAAHRLTAAAMTEGPPVDRLIDDGDETTLRLFGGHSATWRALYTPGHTRGHLCFYETRLGTLVSGDLVLGFGTVLVAPPDGNMKQYLTSLRRLLELPLGFIFPAHGPPVAAAHHKVREYIAHRQAREDAIVAALRGGATLPVDIVRRVYTDVPEAAWPLAELNVRAHLEKLCEEAQVEQRGERFVLRS